MMMMMMMMMTDPKCEGTNQLNSQNDVSFCSLTNDLFVVVRASVCVFLFVSNGLKV